MPPALSAKLPAKLPAKLQFKAELLLATVILYLILLQPNHPAAMTWAALKVFPLELPVIIAVLVLLGSGFSGQLLRASLTAAIGAIALLKLADFGMFVAFNRGFNIVVDSHLLAAGWVLAKGSFGVFWAALALVLVIVLISGVIGALWWALGVWTRAATTVKPRLVAGILLLPALLLAVTEIAHARRAVLLPDAVARMIPGAAFTARVGWERSLQIRTTRADLASFREAAHRDPMATQQPQLDRLGTRDLIIIFVESYGRSSFDNPLYHPTHTATLRAIESDLTARGLALKSAWATAPMVGGQSWLAHGSVASGLWLDHQGRYQALLASPRRTLFHYAQAAGRRTVAIMPAHVFPWPEGEFFGFDAIYNAADLGYQGKPFNWVTMPDQFTLDAFDRFERGWPQGTAQGAAQVADQGTAQGTAQGSGQGADQRGGQGTAQGTAQESAQGVPARLPLVAQVALISSHAPWVPIPPLLPWEDLGDGQIFDQWATSGDPPEVVWRDHDYVRDQFRLAIDYSLQTVGAWAARHAVDPPLIVMLGDHEPARFVSGVDGFDVPLHVLGPPELVALFAEFGWTPGMIPDPELPAVRMDVLRDLILRALSTAPAVEPNPNVTGGCC